MAPHQFFLLFIAVLFVGLAVVTVNQAANVQEATPSHVVVESLPDMPAMPASTGTVPL